MVPIVGSTWSYEEELTFTGFGDEPMSFPPLMTSGTRNNIAPTSTSITGKTTSITKSVISESTAMATLDQSDRDLLLQTIESDLKLNLPVLTNGAYGFGKQIARLAQLAHIADVVDVANSQALEASFHEVKDGKNSVKAIPPSPSPSTLSLESSVSSTGTSARAYALLEKYMTRWFVGVESRGSHRLLYDVNLGGIVSKDGMENISADFGNGR